MEMHEYVRSIQDDGLREFAKATTDVVERLRDGIEYDEIQQVLDKLNEAADELEDLRRRIIAAGGSTMMPSPFPWQTDKPPAH